MQQVTLALIVLLGLAVGSFLNAVIYRLPRNIRIRSGRSRCPHCNRQLRWFHNIPVLSYVVLRGRCAFCKGAISIRYPLVEIVTAILFVYFYWQLGVSFSFAAGVLLSSMMTAIFFIDLEFQIIPDAITLPGMIVGLVVSVMPGGIGIVSSGVGLLVGGGSLYLIAMLGDWLFKKESMGGGDIKMAAMLGAFLGWQKIVLVFMAAALLALLVSVVLMAFSPYLRRSRTIPFGPFLASAAMLSVIYGDQLIRLYLTSVVGLH